jgi:squalene-associated FAD-dependent desaturase
MGCCTNFHHFCDVVGVRRLLAPQPTLFFQTPDGRVSRFKSDPWPAPLHLGRALAAAHYLTASDKIGIGYALARMLAEPPDADPPLREWLTMHRQSARAIDRFWGVVLTSALNETVDRVGLKYARKVFRDGFVRHRDAFTVHVPTVPLSELYGEELREWLRRYGVELRANAGVKATSRDREGAGWSITLRDDTTHSADHLILAVPFDRVLSLLPGPVTADPFFARIGHLQPSPITSVHLWYDRPVLTLPHVVLVDCLGQWVFNRGEMAPGEHYLQVVVSAARSLKGVGRDEITRLIADELANLYPGVRAAKLLRTKVVTEHTATFSAVPGVDAFRPPQQTPVPGLYLAGDYTATGWPATMEGAVRSGYLAAEAVLRAAGREERVVVQDLE